MCGTRWLATGWPASRPANTVVVSAPPSLPMGLEAQWLRMAQSNKDRMKQGTNCGHLDPCQVACAAPIFFQIFAPRTCPLAAAMLGS